MRTWLVMLLLGTIAESAAAQDAPFSGVPEAVKALGSEIFAEREKASAFLFAAGRAAEPALEKARDSNDAEVAIQRHCAQARSDLEFRTNQLHAFNHAPA